MKWSTSGASQGDGRDAQQKKEELVDVELMEKLRNGMLSAYLFTMHPHNVTLTSLPDFGDPFANL
jgi:hypothetical protein